MIAVSSKGTSFRALASYLVRGRTGDETERVAWTAGRNLPTDDPTLAATFMRATAEANARVEKPVYHLVLSFDPRDTLDRATMERVATHVLDRIGLAEHQAILVAHQDRAHPHVHVMVNRVHPTTLKTWDLSHEYRALQRVLRATEQTFGLQVTPGRLADAPERVAIGVSPFDRPETAMLTRGEVHQRTRMAAPSLITRVRAVADHVRDATSWAELEGRLAGHGFRVVPGRDPRTQQARGLLITDGVMHVRASRIGRDFSQRALERRFGVRYAEKDVAIERPHEAVARDVRRLMYVTEERARHYDVTLAATEARRLASTHKALRDRADRSDQIAAERAARATQVEARTRVSLRGLPEVRALEHAVRWGIRQFLPPELEVVRRTLNDVERLLWSSLRSSVSQPRAILRDHTYGRER